MNPQEDLICQPVKMNYHLNHRLCYKKLYVSPRYSLAEETTHFWNTKAANYHQILVAAKKFNMPIRDAIKYRLKYLKEQLVAWSDYIKATDGRRALPSMDVQQIIKEGVALSSRLLLKPNPHRTEGAVTDRMIEEANATPFPNIIELDRGFCCCPFHEDKRPSMYYGARRNIMTCPVCDLKLGPISFIMKRDDLSFIQAVRHLVRVG
jgi:hypothetical protein